MVNLRLKSPSPVPAPSASPRNLSTPDLDRIKQDLADLDSTEVQQILTGEEKRYLLYVERGDVASVRHIIKKAKKENEKKSGSFNINCVDPLGRSALAISVENENVEMLELLLEYEIHPTDSLLYAITEEYVEGVEVLLNHEEKIHKPNTPYSWQTVQGVNASFTPDITPLIQAAHKDNYEILKLLLDRGACLPVPHDVRCGCDDCMHANAEDSLKHSLSRINAYRALTSPSLICLSSIDPLLTAFNLSTELKKLQGIENEFSNEYAALRNGLQKFTMDLVEETRTTFELEVVLNYNDSGKPRVKGEKMELSRLKEAIECRQKPFVGHRNVQQLLGSVWFDGMPGFRRLSLMQQIGQIVTIGCMFPIYCLSFAFAPESPKGVALTKPFIKFIVHLFSYLFFLSLLVIVSLRVEVYLITWFGTDWMKARLKKQMEEARGAFPSMVELTVIGYIFGYIWLEVRSLWVDGLVEYMKDLWNFVDFGINFCYLNWIFMRFTAIFLVLRESYYGLDPYTKREDWHPFDPMLLSEAMFCAANILSFLKLVHVFSVNPHLGPLQISLGRMVFDIIKFFFFYTLVLFAFACGLNQLIGYYAKIDMKICYSLPDGKPNPRYGVSCSNWRRFSNLFETAQTLFWASFGIVDLINFELTGVKEFTRFWGMLMFGSYHVLNIIVLLNLLIAMMSNSYAIIEGKCDVEWKFARSKLWLSYFEDDDILPPPFNLIPIPANFSYTKEEQLEEDVKKEQDELRDMQYNRVTRNLVRRYVTERQKKFEESTITEDDVNEVKQDISTMKYEILNILKINGWKVDSRGGVEVNSSKKQATRERRLMKGFNIGMVEGLEGDRAKKKKDGGFASIVFSLGKAKKKDWNTIVRKSIKKRDQIGSSRTSLRRQSLRDTQRQMTSWDKIQYYQKRGVFMGGEINTTTLKETSKKRNSKPNVKSKWGRLQMLKDKGDLTVENYERATSPPPTTSPSPQYRPIKPQ